MIAPDPLVTRRLPETSFSVSFALDASDRAVLARAGVVLPFQRDIVTVTLVEMNEVVYHLDRAAEEGDTEAGTLATSLLLACDVAHDEAEREARDHA